MPKINLFKILMIIVISVSLISVILLVSCSDADRIGTNNDKQKTSISYNQNSSLNDNQNDNQNDRSDENKETILDDGQVQSVDNNSDIKNSSDNTSTTDEEDLISLDEKTREIISNMTLDEKIMQLFIVTPEQLTGVTTATRAGNTTKLSLEKYPVGGIIYFADNIIDPQQIKSMLKNTQSFSKLGLFLCVDEEGGRVARIGNNDNFDVKTYESMEAVASEDEAYKVGLNIGAYLCKYGFNVDFAPVADVDSNPDNPVIGDRSFGDNPEEVGKKVAKCIEGFHASSMLSTLKHFPGHGDTDSDSHVGEAQVNKNLQELRQCELIPFEYGIKAGADFVMIGHLNVPEVTGQDIPASLSEYIVTNLLRNELGYDGLVITDSCQMKAITDIYSSEKAAIMAIKAGVDIILMPEDLDLAYTGVKSAVESGEISESRIEESLYRIISCKIKSGIIQ